MCVVVSPFNLTRELPKQIETPLSLQLLLQPGRAGDDQVEVLAEALAETAGKFVEFVGVVLRPLVTTVCFVLFQQTERAVFALVDHDVLTARRVPRHFRAASFAAAGERL